MIAIRKSEERGTGRHGWLTTRHTFSFANYHDPQHMGFRDLRVINEDLVAPGGGFGAHRHADMEIISIVMDGALAHRDSTGAEGVLRRGEVQRMSAGSGVVHSEFNASDSEPVHFFQIWILPERQGIAPGYEQKSFPEDDRRGRLRLLVSPDGSEGSLSIHHGSRLYGSILDAGDALSYELASGRGAYVQVARGAINLNGTALSAGDGAAVEDETTLTIAATAPAEILLFDLP